MVRSDAGPMEDDDDASPSSRNRTASPAAARRGAAKCSRLVRRARALSTVILAGRSIGSVRPDQGSTVTGFSLAMILRWSLSSGRIANHQQLLY